MKREKLEAEKRKVLGKKTKKLRKEGLLPANLYGKKTKSLSLQIKTVDFGKVYKSAGETGLVDLKVADKVYPILIHNLQKHPVTEEFLHADLHHVSLEEKITTEVPLVIIGTSPVVAAKQGVLIQPLAKLEIEALPTNLPEKIEIDISTLKEVDQEIKVKDLILPKGVSLASKTDSKTLAVKVGPLEEEVAEAPAPPAEETPEEKPSAEQKEDETKKEGEAVKEKSAEDKAKEKPQEKKPEAK